MSRRPTNQDPDNDRNKKKSPSKSDDVKLPDLKAPAQKRSSFRVEDVTGKSGPRLSGPMPVGVYTGDPQASDEEFVLQQLEDRVLRQRIIRLSSGRPDNKESADQPWKDAHRTSSHPPSSARSRYPPWVMGTGSTTPKRPDRTVAGNSSNVPLGGPARANQMYPSPAQTAESTAWLDKARKALAEAENRAEIAEKRADIAQKNAEKVERKAEKATRIAEQCERLFALQDEALCLKTKEMMQLQEENKALLAKLKKEEDLCREFANTKEWYKKEYEKLSPLRSLVNSDAEYYSDEEGNEDEEEEEEEKQDDGEGGGETSANPSLFGATWEPASSYVDGDEEQSDFELDVEILYKVIAKFNRIHCYDTHNVRREGNRASFQDIKPIHLAIYKNGYIVNGGSFRRFAKETSFITQFINGVWPPELERATIDLEDNHSMFYDPFQTPIFPGKGFRLGCTELESDKWQTLKTSAPAGSAPHQKLDFLPGSYSYSVKNGKVVTTLPDGKHPDENLESIVCVEEVVTNFTKQCATKGALEKAKKLPAHTVLKIQTEDGAKVLILKVLNSEAIGDIRAYIDKHREGQANLPAYHILTANDRKKLSNRRTISEYKLSQKTKLHLVRSQGTDKPKKQTTGVKP